MADDVLPPTPSGSRTTTFYSDLLIKYKINMHPTIFTPTAVSFPNKTTNQDKQPSLSDMPSIQVGQAITRIDSNGTCVPDIITKVIIGSISGESMHLIECMTNQNNQLNIYSLRKLSYPKMFFINSTIRPTNTKIFPQTPATTIGFVPH